VNPIKSWFHNFVYGTLTSRQYAVGMAVIVVIGVAVIALIERVK
jgi:hypothetical protein